MSDFDKVISFGELYRGLRKSKRNVGWKDSVAGYAANGLKNTYPLRQELLAGKYQISPYQRFMVYEPKVREIAATRIRDRQLQSSLCDNAIYPQVTRGFIRDNMACQQGRGVDDALDRLEVHLQRYFQANGPDGYVLRGDVEHFFADTPHWVAKGALRCRLRDPMIAHHACMIVDSFGGDVGVGLGSPVSQLVELAVLDPLDHFIKDRRGVRHYIRYMDDFLVIHPDRAYLEALLGEIQELLAGINLRLNDKTQIFPLKQGITFLKWRFILTRSGRIIRRMSPESIRRERRKLTKMAARAADPEAATSWEDVARSFACWRANALRAGRPSRPNPKRRVDTAGAVEQMLEHLRRICREAGMDADELLARIAPGHMNTDKQSKEGKAYGQDQGEQ